MKRLILIAAMVALTASPAFAQVGSNVDFPCDGDSDDINCAPQDVPDFEIPVRPDRS
jgi:hypothetical protein